MYPYHHVANNGGQVDPLGIEDDVDQVGSVVNEISPVGGRKDVAGEDVVKNLNYWSIVIV